MKVLVRGRIHYTRWTDTAGVERYGCEIIAETIDFLSRGRPATEEEPTFIEDEESPSEGSERGPEETPASANSRPAEAP